MAVGIEKLLANEVSKIVLTRPICEAGENLGFLPGTFEEKISPYLRPLLDAMEELVGVTMAKKLLDTGKVEFAPLAYMRGRTFNNSYVILDEAQNTTIDQIKLFVTRAGNYSTFVVNGDASQCDLRGVTENGLEWICRKLAGRTNMVNVVEFSYSDIQRSPLVAELLRHLDSPDAKPTATRHSFSDGVRQDGVRRA
jgi:phosphate starvation-inducible PhoH-like protein